VESCGRLEVQMFMGWVMFFGASSSFWGGVVEEYQERVGYFQIGLGIGHIGSVIRLIDYQPISYWLIDS
jgi:hypothetical protein